MMSLANAELASCLCCKLQYRMISHHNFVVVLSTFILVLCTMVRTRPHTTCATLLIGKSIVLTTVMSCHVSNMVLLIPFLLVYYCIIIYFRIGVVIAVPWPKIGKNWQPTGKAMLLL
jgi:hypothetical protein